MFRKNFDLSGDLPIHYSLKIGEILKIGDDKKLVDYISSTLGCACFLVDREKNVSLKGLSRVAKHNEFVDIAAFLENPEKLNNFVAKNSSLHPVLVKNRIRSDGKIIENVVFLCTEGKDCLVGVLGDFDIDFELAVSMLKYIKRKS